MKSHETTDSLSISANDKAARCVTLLLQKLGVEQKESAVFVDIMYAYSTLLATTLSPEEWVALQEMILRQIFKPSTPSATH